MTMRDFFRPMNSCALFFHTYVLFLPNKFKSFIIISYFCHPNHCLMCKVLIPALFVLALSVAGVAQTVHQKDKWGAKLLYFQENEVRLQDRWGEQILWYDAAHNTIRQKDRWGEKLYYFDGNTVRMRDRWGDALLYFDGHTIRQKDRWGEALFYLDGNTIRVKDRWGDKLYYFDFTPSRWQIVCTVLTTNL